jgi:hypothetical protein
MTFSLLKAKVDYILRVRCITNVRDGMPRASQQDYGAPDVAVKEKHEGIPPLAHGDNHIGSRRHVG